MADEKKADQEKKKVKIPSAQKRDKQSKERQIHNSGFKSKVKSAIRSFEETLSSSQPKNVVMEKLKTIYSLIDKGVKTNRFAQNKASRTKSRLAQKVAP